MSEALGRSGSIVLVGIAMDWRVEPQPQFVLVAGLLEFLCAYVWVSSWRVVCRCRVILA